MLEKVRRKDLIQPVGLAPHPSIVASFVLIINEYVLEDNLILSGLPVVQIEMSLTIASVQQTT